MEGVGDMREVNEGGGGGGGCEGLEMIRRELSKCERGAKRREEEGAH